MATGDELKNITNILTNINDLREGIANLDINPRLRVYYDYEVAPLLETLDDIENEAGNVGEAAKDIALVLDKSNIEIVKDLYIDFVDQGKDTFKVLEKKIDVLIKIGKET